MATSVVEVPGGSETTTMLQLTVPTVGSQINGGKTNEDPTLLQDETAPLTPVATNCSLDPEAECSDIAACAASKLGCVNASDEPDPFLTDEEDIRDGKKLAYVECTPVVVDGPPSVKCANLCDQPVCQALGECQNEQYGTSPAAKASAEMPGTIDLADDLTGRFIWPKVASPVLTQVKPVDVPGATEPAKTEGSNDQQN